MSADPTIAKELAAELRQLADWIEARPILADTLRRQVFDGGVEYVYPLDWAGALREAGSFDKDADESYLYAIVKPVPGFTLKIMGPRSDVCERVQVGEREVQREVYPDDVKPTVVTEVEPVYEWKCPPSWLERTA